MLHRISTLRLLVALLAVLLAGCPHDLRAPATSPPSPTSAHDIGWEEAEAKGTVAAQETYPQLKTKKMQLTQKSRVQTSETAYGYVFIWEQLTKEGFRTGNMATVVVDATSGNIIQNWASLGKVPGKHPKITRNDAVKIAERELGLTPAQPRRTYRLNHAECLLGASGRNPQWTVEFVVTLVSPDNADKVEWGAGAVIDGLTGRVVRKL